MPNRLDQLDLSFDGKTQEKQWWASVIEEMRRVVQLIGLKEAAFVIDVKPTNLAHALAERDRHYVRAEWILPLLMRAPDMGLARSLVGPAGLDVEEKPELSAEEKLERLELALASSLGPDMRKSIYDKAWRSK